MTDTPGQRPHTFQPAVARRRALDVLFEADVRREHPVDTLQRFRSEEDPALDPFGRDLVRGVGEHLAELDEVIGRHARGWKVPRMPAVDRTILRIATYELIHHPDTPAAVVIDEAIEAAKALSTDDSPRFINGVLEAVRGDVRGG